MTNIGVVSALDEEQHIQSSVIVADSMGVSPKGEKNDQTQKLFHLGPYLLAGTGRVDHLHHTVHLLREKYNQEPLYAIEDAAKGILEVTQNIGLTEQDYFNLLIAGFDSTGIHAFHINTTGNNIPHGGTASWEARTYSPIHSHFDGSGMIQVINASRWSTPRKIETLDEALAAAYEYSLAGTIDTGVNDKLQIGLIQPQQGISLLYAPEVQLIDDALYTNYLSHMIGVPVPQRTERPFTNESLIRENISTTIHKLYDDLMGDLSTHTRFRRIFTYVAEQWADGTLDNTQLRIARSMRERTKQYVTEGTAAVMTREIDAFEKYHQSRESRSQNAFEGTRDYIQSQQNLQQVPPQHM